MAYPAWNDIFNSYYDDYSLEIEKFSKPSHVAHYQPDNAEELSCKFVLMPSPAQGAINYTRNGKFLLIGAYRDTGRDPAYFPVVSNITWSKSGNDLTLFQTNNNVRVGDNVYVYNTNVTGQQYLECIERTNTYFTLKLSSLFGPSSGTEASFRIDRIKNFFEENLVFRLLPSFRLIKISELQEIFNSTAPQRNYNQEENILNLTTDQETKTSSIINENVNYTKVNNYKKAQELIASPLQLQVVVKGNNYFNDNQTFDYNGNPLPLRYDSAGKVIDPGYYDSKYKNTKVFYDKPIVNENPDNGSGPNANDKVWCYDFYGIEINDISRAPYYAKNIITRDTSVEYPVNNFLRRTASGKPIYSATQFVYDNFGNIADGIKADNTLNVTKQRIPLQLDNFGRPTKLPL